MKFKIVSDSSSNMLSFEDVLYQSVPLKVISSEKEYTDDASLDVLGMVEDLKTVKGSVTTSCPNVMEWLDAFCDADGIFAITITSRLSGCFNSAKMASEEYMAENPNVKIHVIDSLSTGGEMQLIIEKLAELIKEGKDFEEIRDEIEEYKKHTHLIFSLQSLTNLARNGRISPAAAAFAGILGIRVVGSAIDGTLHPSHKARGEKKAISTIVDIMKEKGFSGGKLVINHCFNPEAATDLKNKVLALFPMADIKTVPCTALCSFYAEMGGLIIGYEGA